jgi:inner membrane transporter RhtA
VLAAMNITFYTAIHYLPLGTAVAIEFIGPVAVGAITGHGWRERAGIALAAVGVVLLAGVTLELYRPAAGGRGPIAPHPGPGLLAGHEATLGLVAIVLSAIFWAGYILIGRRVSQHGSGVTNLSMAMAAGAIVFTPALAWWATPVVTSWSVALAVVGVAVLSSVIPYAIDQVVMRRTSAATFAVLLAMLPATAMIVGVVVLGQIPRALEVVGLALVSGAIALTMARRRAVA